jgi:transposase
VYAEDILTELQCQNWFAKFHSDNFDIKDAPYSGRPVEANKDKIKVLIKVKRGIAIREIAARFHLSKSLT